MTRAPRGDSGSCGPHARSPSSSPRSRSIDSAIATCSGSPPCDAHASASSSSPHPISSKPPDAMSGITWNGLAHDRHMVTVLGLARGSDRACPLRIDDGRVHAVARFDARATSDHDIEIELAHAPMTVALGR